VLFSAAWTCGTIEAAKVVAAATRPVFFKKSRRETEFLRGNCMGGLQVRGKGRKRDYTTGPERKATILPVDSAEAKTPPTSVRPESTHRHHPPIARGGRAAIGRTSGGTTVAGS